VDIGRPIGNFVDSDALVAAVPPVPTLAISTFETDGPRALM
jgi:hypothetical protein